MGIHDVHVPRFSVRTDACAVSVYQALLPCIGRGMVTRITLNVRHSYDSGNLVVNCTNYKFLVGIDVQWSLLYSTKHGSLIMGLHIF